MIDPRTERLIRVKVLDNKNNVNAIFDYFEKNHPDTTRKDIYSKYGIDYLEDCLMINGDSVDLIEVSEWFPHAILYGVIAWRDEEGYHARQAVASNGQCWIVSFPITLGFDLEDARVWNIGDYMHLYGSTDAVEAGKAMYGYKEEEN